MSADYERVAFCACLGKTSHHLVCLDRRKLVSNLTKKKVFVSSVVYLHVVTFGAHEPVTGIGPRKR